MLQAWAVFESLTRCLCFGVLCGCRNSIEPRCCRRCWKRRPFSVGGGCRACLGSWATPRRARRAARVAPAGVARHPPSTPAWGPERLSRHRRRRPTRRQRPRGWAPPTRWRRAESFDRPPPPSSERWSSLTGGNPVQAPRVTARGLNKGTPVTSFVQVHGPDLEVTLSCLQSTR